MSTQPTSTVEVARQRPGLTAPYGTSKSMRKAMRCATFFTGQYLQRGLSGEGEQHWLTRTGTEFHSWRHEYVDHLIETKQSRDDAFKQSYLQRHGGISADAQRLITYDQFEVNPDEIYGPEVFLSVDKHFQPLDHEIGNSWPGRLSSNPESICSGTIDLLLLSTVDGELIATVRDAKSGFSTQTIDDAEPPIYAGLVLLHFPEVREVRFVWDFVRLQGIKVPDSYTREDLEWIKPFILEGEQLKQELVRKYNANEPVGFTLGDNCPYCELRCEIRDRIARGEVFLAPPQTEDDARMLAQIKKAAEDIVPQVNKLLGAYLSVNYSFEVLPGWEAAVRVSDQSSYPLLGAIDALGLALVKKSDAPRNTVRPLSTDLFDVPLSALTVGGLSGIAKTKKSKAGVSREGLRDTLAGIAKKSASTTVLVRKIDNKQIATPDDEISTILEAGS